MVFHNRLTCVPGLPVCLYPSGRSLSRARAWGESEQNRRLTRGMGRAEKKRLAAEVTDFSITSSSTKGRQLVAMLVRIKLKRS